METLENFPHAFIIGEYSVGAPPKARDELEIISLSSSIRDKPNWETKISDPEIVSKWRKEVENMVPQIRESEKKFNFVLKELEWVAASKDPVTGIQNSTVDGTFHSDTLVEESLRCELINAIADLESVPEEAKDWHPGTNDIVLDLVHPSLYPLLIGRSKILKEVHCQSNNKNTSEGNSQASEYDCLLYFSKEDEFLPQDEAIKIALAHTASLPSYAKSEKYQWLPSEVMVDEEGNAKFSSYINNLHPERYPAIYACTEKILTKFVPIFEKVLTELRNPHQNRITLDGDWYEEVPEPEESSSSENASEEESVEPIRVFKPIEIPSFEEPPLPTNFVKLNGRNLQVIVKLANIHLTPEKPKYNGGVWHLEGMANERIAASGIYYYAFDNVTESRLKFRQAVQEPDYEQYDERGVYEMYRLVNEGELNQEIGSILTKEGRCISFPNNLQHQVAPFELEDKTRAGYRKILVFFLVDPSVQIVSTARVPPQQKAWFLGEIDKKATPVPDLVVHKIVGMMNWPMSLEEAKILREDLMQERKFFVKDSNENFFERPFSLCEH